MSADQFAAAAISRMRDEVRGLLVLLDSAVVRSKPMRSENHQGDQIDVWHDSRILRVQTIANAEGLDAVYLFQPKHWAIEVTPDWTCLSSSEATALGNDLVAAARAAGRASA